MLDESDIVAHNKLRVSIDRSHKTLKNIFKVVKTHIYIYLIVCVCVCVMDITGTIVIMNSNSDTKTLILYGMACCKTISHQLKWS